MRSFIINKAQEGKRIDNILRDKFPKMPQSSMFKAFRKKDIKINGKRIKENYIVASGDEVQVYIVDNILDGVLVLDNMLDGVKVEDASSSLDIVFEDSNLIIVNKKQGVSVHSDEIEDGGEPLIDAVLRYLVQKGEYSALLEGEDSASSGFVPALCHRLDRNTGGLVIIAKTKEAYNILLKKIKEREIKKYYLCYVKGFVQKPFGVLKSYLSKDKKNSRVFISDKPGKDKLTIITQYRVLNHIKGQTPDADLTYVEVELITGRTHQIRAHFAHIGHPLLGDGKYGVNTLNKRYGVKHQVLWAYKMVFDFRDNGGLLSYLKGRVIEVEPGFGFENR
jgi:23S rRNA pseudouridine955/2504/2580 synthase